jgi:hypothetical protein
MHGDDDDRDDTATVFFTTAYIFDLFFCGRDRERVDFGRSVWSLLRCDPPPARGVHYSKRDLAKIRLAKAVAVAGPTLIDPARLLQTLSLATLARWKAASFTRLASSLLRSFIPYPVLRRLLILIFSTNPAYAIYYCKR